MTNPRNPAGRNQWGAGSRLTELDILEIKRRHRAVRDARRAWYELQTRHNLSNGYLSQVALGHGPKNVREA